MRALLVVCVISLGGVAHADDRALAREHYLKGTNAFDLGAYDEAISEYSTAYRLRNDPALLYNIAQAHRLAGHPVEAIRFYKTFLSKVPGASKRADIETKIAELQKLVEQQKKAESIPPTGVQPLGSTPEQKPPESTPAETTPPKHEEQPPQAEAQPAPVPAPAPVKVIDARAGRTKKVAGLVVGGVGVAALAAGIGLSVAAKQASDDLTALDANGATFDPAKYSTGKTFGLVGPVLIGVGAAAVVAGVVVSVLGIREGKAAHRIAARADGVEVHF